MRSLSIVVTSGIFPPDHGGPATYVPTIAAELVRRGHRVVVVCLADDPAGGASFPFAVRRIGRRLFKPWRALRTVAEILTAARDADVVFVNGLALESWLASAIARKPTVHKVVGDTAWERAVNRGWFSATLDAYQSARKSIVLRILDFARSLPLRRARAVFTPSDYLRGIVRGWKVPDRRLHVIRNAAIDEGHAEAPRGRSPLPAFPGKTIVSISRLVAWKGLEALVGIVTRAEGWRLVVVGDGPLRAELEHRAAVAPDRIILTGSVPHPEALAILAGADAFVLNSTYEGLPHVVLEAMAAGVPVVATRAGGTGEVVIDRTTGLLVTPGDDRQLEESLREILGDPELAGRLVANARRRLVEEFGFRRMVDATERLLLDAAGEPG